MRVSLIANTYVHDRSMAEAAPAWDGTLGADFDADLLVEFAGRACYQSWDNPSGRDNRAYIGNIIEQGHFSVLEHASATFYIEGVSRALTHELVRHRHFSFSQLSQRFVNLSSAQYVVPPALRELLDDNRVGPDGPTVRQVLDNVFSYNLMAYDALVELLHLGKGLPRKQAREAARAVLPNMVETSIVVSGNHRSWREFVQKRYSVHADAEIRQLAGGILVQLRRIAPNIYQDIPEEPAE
jgi:thymidylate synthase (FAD)